MVIKILDFDPGKSCLEDRKVSIAFVFAVHRKNDFVKVILELGIKENILHFMRN
jgi:hypothetical protein